MRRDIQPNERAFSSKEVAEEVGIATPTVRKYGQILERNGYEFLKDGDRRIFVQSDIESLIALRDTDKPLDDTAKDLVVQQKERLKETNQTDVALPDTYENLPQDPNQLREVLMLLANELAATREMNAQLTNDMSELKVTVSRLQQDHHAISANVGNAAQKTNAKIEKLTNQQKEQYEALLEQEKEKSELLQQEIQKLREEQIKEWRLQNDFNRRLEIVVQSRPKSKWEAILSLFRK
jgi:DNA-binding transcriptional regulator YhcF (GntR family)/outer membrane murein-binding lipoprotein Lpp